MNARQVFGSVLSTILLGLFLYFLAEAYDVGKVVVDCKGDDDVLMCMEEARAGFNAPMQSGLNMIGGLVAAIVIAELAITKPTEAPAARLFGGPSAPSPTKVVQYAATVYVAVWVVTGLFAYLWASVRHPTAIHALTDYGNAWLGLAVASGYSYFGVNRTP